MNYRVTIRRAPEQVDIAAEDVAEALALTAEYYPGAAITQIENEDGSEAEVVRGVCSACGAVVTEGGDMVSQDDRDYCLACARKHAG